MTKGWAIVEVAETDKIYVERHSNYQQLWQTVDGVLDKNYIEHAVYLSEKNKSITIVLKGVNTFSYEKKV